MAGAAGNKEAAMSSVHSAVHHADSIQAQRCSLCAAAEVADGSRCMLCLRKISPCLFTLAPERPESSGLFWPQFTLAAIFLATTLAACWLSLIHLSLDYALGVLAVGMPAVVRTGVLMGIGRRSGRQLSTRETVAAFIASVAALVVPMMMILLLFQWAAARSMRGGVFWDPHHVLAAAALVGALWAVSPAFRR
jgi:Flp pilus assembly protein TadB